MSEATRTRRQDVRPGRTWASAVSAGCLVRGLPLFFRAAPRTPLRVLAIIALDVLHVLRRSQPLPKKRVGELAMFLDFEGWTNAAWDHKRLCETDYRMIRQRLEAAGLGGFIAEYLVRLRALEGRRPSIDGDQRRFDEVRAYREAVARLSLATITALTLTSDSIEDAIEATHSDSDVETLFRIAMQCQIMDDVLDYEEDASAGLPSFLTACASLPQAMELTARAARSYGASSKHSPCGGVFPLRMALAIVTAATRLVVRVAMLRHRQVRPIGRPAVD